MNSAGVTPQSLQQKWQFAVQIKGFDAAFFNKADLPEAEFDEVEFNPAGSLFPQKVAGRMKFNDLTFEKGVPQENPEENILNWMRQCVTVASATGGVPTDYMRDIDLVQYSRNGTQIRRFRLFNAFIKTAKMGDVEGGSSENVIESMTVCFQYFDTV